MLDLISNNKGEVSAAAGQPDRGLRAKLELFDDYCEYKWQKELIKLLLEKEEIKSGN